MSAKPMKDELAPAPAGFTWAIGENGIELTPIEDTVEIEELPVGPHNMVIPASVRSFGKYKEGQGIPTRVTKIERCETPVPHIAVHYRCTRFVRFEWQGKKRFGLSSVVAVFNLRDAQDPLFSRLSDADRRAILLAVTT